MRPAAAPWKHQCTLCFARHEIPWIVAEACWSTYLAIDDVVFSHYSLIRFRGSNDLLDLLHLKWVFHVIHRMFHGLLQPVLREFFLQASTSSSTIPSLLGVTPLVSCADPHPHRLCSKEKNVQSGFASLETLPSGLWNYVLPALWVWRARHLSQRMMFHSSLDV